MEEDWVSKLQAYCQKEKIMPPSYIFAERGDQPEHSPLFIATVLIQGFTICGGAATNKKQAKRQAAYAAIRKIIHNEDASLSPVNKECVITIAKRTNYVILIDVDNFPRFIEKIDSQVLAVSRVYAFTTKPIDNPPTGVNIIMPKGPLTTPRTTHTYMTAFLGSLLKDGSDSFYMIVAGDKLANELVRLANDDSLGWLPRKAAQCKRAQDLLL
jgi:hypothetical protein